MTKNCPKCLFEMKEGMLGYDRVISLFTKEKIGDLRGARHKKLDPRDGKAVVVYHCPQCGYIELFAAK